jgi:uncharacterized protein YhfF
MRRRRGRDSDSDAIVTAMPQTSADLPSMQLGYPRTELRRKLVDAVLRGEKTATASLRADYEPHTDEPLPRVGGRWVLRDFSDEPVAVVATKEVRVLRAGDVDLAFALDEGEGFESVADWRRAHEEFWADQEIGDDTLIVAERFRVVERFRPS